MSELESMEIDEIVDLNQKRTIKRLLDDNLRPTSSSSTSTISNKIKSNKKLSNCKYLKAKRSTNKSIIDHNHYLILIIDTNILIENLNLLKKLLLNNSNNDNKRNILNIIIPYNVIQELDGLKLNLEKLHNVTNAIKFINEQLKLSDKSKIICSKKTTTKTLDSNDNNDDQILDFCIKFKQNPKDFLSSPFLIDEKQNLSIVFITNDCNLQNKAFINDLDCYTMKEFFKKFKFLTKIEIDNNRCLSNSTLLSDNVESVNNRFTSTQQQQQEQFPVKRFRGETKKIETICNKNNFNNKLTDNNKMSINIDNNNNNDVDIDLKYQLEIRLSEFIVEKYREIFGDEMLTLMLKKYNPKTATLKDSLRKFKYDWIGIFSDYFDRNPEVTELVDKMLLSVANRDNKDNIKSLLTIIEKGIARKLKNK